MVRRFALVLFAATFFSLSAQAQTGLRQVEKLIADHWENPIMLASAVALLLEPKKADREPSLLLAQAAAEQAFDLINNNPDPARGLEYMGYRWLIYPPLSEYYFLAGEHRKALLLAKEAAAALPDHPKFRRSAKRIDRAIAKYAAAVNPPHALGDSNNETSGTPAPRMDSCVDGLCEPLPHRESGALGCGGLLNDKPYDSTSVNSAHPI